MNKVKNTIFLALTGIFFLSPVYAAVSPKSTAAEYIVYFFNLAVAVGAFIAVVMIVMAGIDYVTAEGNASKIDDAKGKIRNALLGLAVLLGSFLILNTINPGLTSIIFKGAGKQPQEEITVSEGAGVYLYDAENFVSNNPLMLKETKAGFVQDDNFKTQSIKFVNSETFKFGAVLFSDSNLRGNCSYLLNSISSLNSASGNENNPPIGNNNLSSIVVFKTNSGSSSVKFYNNINCQAKSDDYCIKGDKDNPCQEDKNKVCSVSSKDGFENIKNACPDFKGDILSIEVSGGTAVLFKAADKGAEGRCQFFEPGNGSCINTVKYSYVYKTNYEPTSSTVNPGDLYIPITPPSLNPGSGTTASSYSSYVIKPVSFMLFPLVK